MSGETKKPRCEAKHAPDSFRETSDIVVTERMLWAGLLEFGSVRAGMGDAGSGSV